MNTQRQTLIAVNLASTRGDRFECEAFRHIRTISWTKETPREVDQLRQGKPGNWGGATLNADQYAVLFDGPGKRPSELEIARIVERLQHPHTETTP